MAKHKKVKPLYYLLPILAVCLAIFVWTLATASPSNKLAAVLQITNPINSSSSSSSSSKPPVSSSSSSNSSSSASSTSSSSSSTPTKCKPGEILCGSALNPDKQICCSANIGCGGGGDKYHSPICEKCIKEDNEPGLICGDSEHQVCCYTSPYNYMCEGTATSPTCEGKCKTPCGSKTRQVCCNEDQTCSGTPMNPMCNNCTERLGIICGADGGYKECCYGSKTCGGTDLDPVCGSECNDGYFLCQGKGLYKNHKVCCLGKSEYGACKFDNFGNPGCKNSVPFVATQSTYSPIAGLCQGENLYASTTIPCSAQCSVDFFGEPSCSTGSQSSSSSSSSSPVLTTTTSNQTTLQAIQSQLNSLYTQLKQLLGK